MVAMAGVKASSLKSKAMCKLLPRQLTQRPLPLPSCHARLIAMHHSTCGPCDHSTCGPCGSSAEGAQHCPQQNHLRDKQAKPNRNVQLGKSRPLGLESTSHGPLSLKPSSTSLPGTRRLLSEAPHIGLQATGRKPRKSFSGGSSGKVGGLGRWQFCCLKPMDWALGRTDLSLCKYVVLYRRVSCL